MSADPARELCGVVYIAESDLDWLAVNPDAHLFEGNWDRDSSASSVEKGPGWDSVDAAIEWGRQRAAKILLRIGRTGPLQVHFSAGLINPWADGKEQIPDWPPSSEDLPLIQQQLTDDDGAEEADPQVAAAVALMRRRLDLRTRPEIVWLDQASPDQD